MSNNLLNPANQASNLVTELRELRAEANKAKATDLPRFVALNERFVAKFTELDTLLSNNGGFPSQWITKENQYRLSGDETNASYSTY